MCSCTGVSALSLSKWRQDHAAPLDGFMYVSVSFSGCLTLYRDLRNLATASRTMGRRYLGYGRIIE